MDRYFQDSAWFLNLANTKPFIIEDSQGLGCSCHTISRKRHEFSGDEIKMTLISTYPTIKLKKENYFKISV